VSGSHFGYDNDGHLGYDCEIGFYHERETEIGFLNDRDHVVHAIDFDFGTGSRFVVSSGAESATVLGLALVSVMVNVEMISETC
jgi:hypothetical protein